MLIFDANGKVVPPGRYADTSRHFNASAGVLPASMTVGTIDGVTNTPDTGVTSSFIGGGSGDIAALQIVSGTQAGSTRRASLYATKIDLTKVCAVHMKAIITGGGGSSRAPRMGLLNNPTGSSASGFILNQVGGVNTSRLTVVDAGGSTNFDLSYPWGAPPARHELHIWLTCEDRMLYVGTGESDFDYSRSFVGDMDLGTVVPHLAIQSAVGSNATLQVHEWNVTPYFW